MISFLPKMKRASQLLVMVAAIAASVSPVAAAGKGGKNKGRRTEPAAQPSPATAKPASETLSSFLGQNLDRLLAPLDTGLPMPGRADDGDFKVIKVSLATRSEVTNMDQRFRAEASAAAPAVFVVSQRAVAVTTTLTQLMDERDKQLSVFVDSRTKRSVSDLEKKKGKHQRKDARREVHETKNFMSAGLEQQWLQTAVRYRQQINAQMDALRAVERPAKAAAPTQ